MKESNRQKKFGKLLQKELSEVFQRDLHLEGEPMLTVTVVRASPDFAQEKLGIEIRQKHRSQRNDREQQTKQNVFSG